VINYGSIVPGYRISISELVSKVLFYDGINLWNNKCNKYVLQHYKQSVFEGRTS